MTDYNDKVIENAEKNILKNLNASDKRWEFLNLDWTKSDEFDLKFDFIVGADLIYSGAPLNDLYKTIKRVLDPSGIFFLLVPT